MSIVKHGGEESSAPPTVTPAQRMLLDFLREYDAACPVCGYNVRALTRPICPECRQELTLTVGVTRLRLGWLFAALAPGFFSGIAAFFLIIPIVARIFFGDGIVTWLLVAVDAFGWLSGLFAILLAFVWRNRFIAQSRGRQRTWTVLIWGVHLIALGLLIIFGPMVL